MRDFERRTCLISKLQDYRNHKSLKLIPQFSVPIPIKHIKIREIETRTTISLSYGIEITETSTKLSQARDFEMVNNEFFTSNIRNRMLIHIFSAIFQNFPGNQTRKKKIRRITESALQITQQKKKREKIQNL